MSVNVDNETGAAQALSAANCLSRIGAVDGTVSGNATVTLLAAAVKALPLVAGTSQDDLNKVALGLQKGVLAGAMAETHTYTTIAGMVAGIAANIPNYPSTFDGFLPQ